LCGTLVAEGPFFIMGNSNGAIKKLSDQVDSLQKQLATAQENQKLETQLKATASLLADYQKKEKEAQSILEARFKANKGRIDRIGMIPDDRNICITGRSGAGKSTMINSLRGLRPRDPGSAQTSAAVECTTEFSKYSWSTSIPVSLTLWDMSGGSTDDQPDSSYCYDHCLDLFDCIVLCLTSRFTHLDTLILTYAVKKKLPLVVVYNKIDLDVLNMVENEGKASTNEEAFSKLKIDLMENFSSKCWKNGIASPPSLFLVNAHSFRTGKFKYDEIKLLEFVAMAASRGQGDIRDIMKNLLTMDFQKRVDRPVA